MQLACSRLPPLLRLHALFFYTPSTIREEVSHRHGTRVLFWPGNCVGASPYTRQPTSSTSRNVQRANFVELRVGEVRRILLPRRWVNRGAMRKCLTLMNSAEQRSKPERERPEPRNLLRALSDSI